MFLALARIAARSSSSSWLAPSPSMRPATSNSCVSPVICFRISIGFVRFEASVKPLRLRAATPKIRDRPVGLIGSHLGYYHQVRVACRTRQRMDCAGRAQGRPEHCTHLALETQLEM